MKTELDEISRQRAIKMFEYLKRERLAGRITPQKKITQEALAKIAKDVSQREIQYWFEWLSREGYGIASTATGCYVILKSDEFNETIKYLHSKAVNSIERLKLVVRAQQNFMKNENSLFEEMESHPIIKKLEEEFQTIII